MSSSRRGYTLPETIVVFGLIVLALTGVVAGARVWLNDQHTSQVEMVLDSAVAAQHAHHSRFATFAADKATLEGQLGGVTVWDVTAPTAHRPTDVVLATGNFAHPSAGDVAVAVVAVTDITVCRYRVVPDPDVTADVITGDVDGRCDPTTLPGLLGVT